MSDRSFLERGLDEPLIVIDEERHDARLKPMEWVRKRLFNSWYNSVITVLLTGLILYAGLRLFSFVFVTARWQVVRTNLTLFMVGRYPRAEMWRVVAQVLVWSGTLGLAWGAAVAGARHRARRAGAPFRDQPILSHARRYWGMLVLVLLVLLLTRTFGPLLVLVAALALGALLRWTGAKVSGEHVGLAWAGVAILGVMGYQIVSGFYGNGWVWIGVPVSAVALNLLGQIEWSSPLRRRLVRWAAVVAVFAILYLAYTAVDHRGVGWDKWEGLRLNLLSAPIAIVLAFPLGLILALARRSSLPVLRMLSTGYIELIRGVPLITLLLMGQLFIGFFLATTTPLSSITRAIAALTLFTSAYIAEIVRGGLQSVPRAQIEAGQSLGLSPFTVTRLIVLPQALRAVIPAMVGQFIALVKDTTLLSIIGVAEILQVRTIVHAQAEFRGIGIAETLVFVGFVFWAITFTMSRESQRLERRLGVGER